MWLRKPEFDSQTGQILFLVRWWHRNNHYHCLLHNDGTSTCLKAIPNKIFFFFLIDFEVVQSLLLFCCCVSRRIFHQHHRSETKNVVRGTDPLSLSCCPDRWVALWSRHPSTPGARGGGRRCAECSQEGGTRVVDDDYDDDGKSDHRFANRNRTRSSVSFLRMRCRHRPRGAEGGGETRRDPLTEEPSHRREWVAVVVIPRNERAVRKTRDGGGSRRGTGTQEAGIRAFDGMSIGARRQRPVGNFGDRP